MRGSIRWLIALATMFAFAVPVPAAHAVCNGPPKAAPEDRFCIDGIPCCGPIGDPEEVIL
jgi:hypothetical protein